MMNHAIHKPLFSKQESQESIQESRNQAKNLKIPESRRRKFRVEDPSGFEDRIKVKEEYQRVAKGSEGYIEIRTNGGKRARCPFRDSFGSNC